MSIKTLLSVFFCCFFVSCCAMDSDSDKADRESPALERMRRRSFSSPILRNKSLDLKDIEALREQLDLTDMGTTILAKKELEAK